VPGSPIVLGGNKSLLFNGEYMFSIASQVRIVAFYDAGQVRNFGEKFVWMEDLTRTTPIVPAALRSVRHRQPHRSDRAHDDHRADRAHQRVQDLDRSRAALLHAGAERAVPADLLVQPAAGGVLDNNLQAGEEDDRSASRWEPRSRLGT
jgi:hypothetical protein